MKNKTDFGEVAMMAMSLHITISFYFFDLVDNPIWKKILFFPSLFIFLLLALPFISVMILCFFIDLFTMYADGK